LFDAEHGAFLVLVVWLMRCVMALNTLDRETCTKGEDQGGRIACQSDLSRLRGMRQQAADVHKPPIKIATIGSTRTKIEKGAWIERNRHVFAARVVPFVATER
jgi:hypothetical protein